MYIFPLSEKIKRELGKVRRRGRVCCWCKCSIFRPVAWVIGSYSFWKHTIYCICILHYSQFHLPANDYPQHLFFFQSTLKNTGNPNEYQSEVTVKIQQTILCTVKIILERGEAEDLPRHTLKILPSRTYTAVSSRWVKLILEKTKLKEKKMVDWVKVAVQ